MLSHYLPLCIYDQQFPEGSIRRIFIGVTTILLMMLSLGIYVLLVKKYPALRWGFFLPPLIVYQLGRRWMKSKNSSNLKTLRFDWRSERFRYEYQDIKLEFHSREAQLISVTNGVLHIKVRETMISFPENVPVAGNFLTGLYMDHKGKSYGLHLTFQNDQLKILPL